VFLFVCVTKKNNKFLAASLSFSSQATRTTPKSEAYLLPHGKRPTTLSARWTDALFQTCGRSGMTQHELFDFLRCNGVVSIGVFVLFCCVVSFLRFFFLLLFACCLLVSCVAFSLSPL
jgi:hypothetical protein